MGQTLRYCQICRRDTWQSDTVGGNDYTHFVCSECQTAEDVPDEREKPC